eukprot:tig00001130_g7230.t1
MRIWKAEVLGARLVGTLGAHVQYDIEVTWNAESGRRVVTTVSHRFREFEGLQAALLRVSPPSIPLPPKKSFGNLDCAFVEKRKARLQQFLDAALARKELASSLPLQMFLVPIDVLVEREREALRRASSAPPCPEPPPRPHRTERTLSDPLPAEEAAGQQRGARRGSLAESAEGGWAGSSAASSPLPPALIRALSSERSSVDGPIDIRSARSSPPPSPLPSPAPAASSAAPSPEPAPSTTLSPPRASAEAGAGPGAGQEGVAVGGAGRGGRGGLLLAAASFPATLLLALLLSFYDLVRPAPPPSPLTPPLTPPQLAAVARSAADAKSRPEAGEAAAGCGAGGAGGRRGGRRRAAARRGPRGAPEAEAAALWRKADAACAALLAGGPPAAEAGAVAVCELEDRVEALRQRLAARPGPCGAGSAAGPSRPLRLLCAAFGCEAAAPPRPDAARLEAARLRAAAALLAAAAATAASLLLPAAAAAAARVHALL